MPIEGPHQEDQFWIDLLPSPKSRPGFSHIEKFTSDLNMINQLAEEFQQFYNGLITQVSNSVRILKKEMLTLLK